jgi:hypothetical protein
MEEKKERKGGGGRTVTYETKLRVKRNGGGGEII